MHVIQNNIDTMDNPNKTKQAPNICINFREI